MLTVTDLSVSFGSTTLFEDVNLKFHQGNCYGLIGANGAGKSTFLKVLSGDVTPSEGNVLIDDNHRLAVLRQNQFAFDSYSVIETVLMGYPALYDIYSERQAIYSKEEMTEAEGLRAGELESQFGEMDGYTAEAEAATMLSDLGIPDSVHENKMATLDAGQKIRVLLAQALFGNPDILLLDEPTNQLDYLSVLWLEKYLLEFKNTVIVVSHDRHFLNKVCTHIADVDFGKIKIYPGNYDFWKTASELAMRQRQDQSKKDAKKVKELEEFVRRFSANASKSKQATSRKKLIEKLTPEDLPVSSRRSPYIHFEIEKPCGTRILEVNRLRHAISGESVLNNVSFTVERGEKIAIVGKDSRCKTALLQALAKELTPSRGHVSWGETMSIGYFPKDNAAFFESDLDLFSWLSQFDSSGDSQKIRGYLGRMLFSGEDALKSVSVLSGGEKARAMFSKIMIASPNALIMDEPTDHLDLEAITALNEGLNDYSGSLIFTSHDFQLLNSVANRVIEVGPNGMISQKCSFHEYMQNEQIQEKREQLYTAT